LYRLRGELEVLLIHPGGPFFKGRDDGVWSIPKGEYTDEEEPLTAALREFAEETGSVLVFEEHDPQPLGLVTQRSGKVVSAWAARGEFDPSTLASNRFTLEWPPRSGQLREFPEVDRAEWFDLATAARKLVAAQAPFLDRLQALLS
jgi:predicted NUDIX family NTP pyrophosphohydrolase